MRCTVSNTGAGRAQQRNELVKSLSIIYVTPLTQLRIIINESIQSRLLCLLWNFTLFFSLFLSLALVKKQTKKKPSRSGGYANNSTLLMFQVQCTCFLLNPTWLKPDPNVKMCFHSV